MNNITGNISTWVKGSPTDTESKALVNAYAQKIKNLEKELEQTQASLAETKATLELAQTAICTAQDTIRKERNEYSKAIEKISKIEWAFEMECLRNSTKPIPDLKPKKLLR